MKEEPVMIMRFINSYPPYEPYPVNISSITYTPVSNFWIPQGYTWQFGSLNVTKGNLTTPLRLSTGDETEIEQFSKALLTHSEKNGDLEITYTNITAGPRNTTSGNGIASLNLNAVRTEVSTIPKLDNITVEFAEYLPETFRIRLESEIGTINNLLTSSSRNVTINRLDLILSVE